MFIEHIEPEDGVRIQRITNRKTNSGRTVYVI